jgi:hypothetical protein
MSGNMSVLETEYVFPERAVRPTESSHRTILSLLQHFLTTVNLVDAVSKGRLHLEHAKAFGRGPRWSGKVLA